MVKTSRKGGFLFPSCKENRSNIDVIATRVLYQRNVVKNEFEIENKAPQNSMSEAA